MTGTLPDEFVQAVERSPEGELVTVDAHGQPRAQPVVGALDDQAGCLEVTTAPDQSRHAEHEPRVGVLVGEAPLVLVQGTARVLWTGRLRVRPERIYAWPEGDVDAEPRLFDAHLEEVRSAHNAEPETGHAPPEGGATAWDPRLDALGPVTAALAFVGPDGFPFAVRLPVRADRAGGVVHLDADPVGAPIEAGLACLSAAGLRLCGDLVEEHGRWLLRPHQVIDAQSI
jgi:Pyridoxamine 5'-phosphate oxidase